MLTQKRLEETNMISLTAIATALLVGWLARKGIDQFKRQTASLGEGAMSKEATVS
jgi:uncharacterized membrane protein (DUF441 family)